MSDLNAYGYPQYGSSMHYPYCDDGDCTGCLPSMEQRGVVPIMEWLITPEGTVELVTYAGQQVLDALRGKGDTETSES